MKLWLFSTFESGRTGGGEAFLVAAETEKEARALHPTKYAEYPLRLSLDTMPDAPGELWRGDYYE